MYWRIVALSAIFTFVALPADTFEDLRKQADGARTEHHTSDAVTLYEKALHLRTNWVEGWWDLGKLYYVSGQFAKAGEAFQHFSGVAPQVGEGWGMQGMAAMQAGAYSDSLAFIDKSLFLNFDMQPSMRDTLLIMRASLLSRVGKFDDAIVALLGYIQGEPSADLLNALGIAALHRKWLPSEIPASDRDLVSAAGGAEFAVLTNNPDAQQSAEQLETRFPKAPGVHYFAGSIDLDRDAKRAEEEFRQELAIAPNDVDACSMLGYTLLLNHGDLRFAGALEKRAVSVDPSRANFQYALGRVLDAQGDHGAAVGALEAAVKLMPDSLEYHIALAAAYAAAGRSQEAISERRRALELKFSHGT